MKLFFARHGESEANLSRIISNREAPHGLTSSGRTQALDLANYLADAGITAIFASPILRARQTAEIVSQTLGVPVTIADALKEFDCGVMEGRSDAEAWAAHAEVGISWFENDDLNARIEGGESFFDIRDRFVPWVEELTNRYRDSDTSLLLVSHGGTMRCALPLLMSNVSVGFINERGFSYTATIEADYEGGQLRCVQWNGEAVS